MPIQQITTGIIQDGAVVATDIANGTVTGPKLGANSVSSNNIVSVLGSAITANTIANSAIQTGAVENYLRGANLDFGMRNRIINGAMVVAQRGTSAVTTDESFPVDRFQLQVVNANLSLIQSSDAPAGFNFSIAATVTSTTSANANDRSRLFQNIEGLNVADLAWGTANARPITVSFWARSTVTGTYSGNITNSAGNRSYIFTYTINSANTWEYETITIPGDTSGTWLKTNGNGMCLNPITFNCGSSYQGTAGSWIAGDARGTSGSTYLATNNSGAVFNITGVQLEEGSVPTSFEYRQYGTEIALCQRYFQFLPMSIGAASGTTAARGYGAFSGEMRTTPAVGATGVLNITDAYAADFTQSSGAANVIVADNRMAFFDIPNFTGLTTGRVYFFPRLQNNNKISLSAEL